MALARMGDHRLPKRILSGKLEDAGKRARGSRQGKKMGGLCGRLHLNITFRGDLRTTSPQTPEGAGVAGRSKQVHGGMEEGIR